MTLQELLDSPPLMANARVVAGSSGLGKEISWCLPDTYQNLERSFLPGMLLLATGAIRSRTTGEALERIWRLGASGVVFFSRPGSGPAEASFHEVLEAYDRAGVPLIELNGGNTTTFMKRLAITLSDQFSKEMFQEDWLRNICLKRSVPDMDNALEHGYVPGSPYCCVLAVPSSSQKVNPISEEMDANLVRNHLHDAFSRDGRGSLCYVDRSTVVSFLPPAGTFFGFREQLGRLSHELHGGLSSLRWKLYVGSTVYRLADFSTSYGFANDLLYHAETIGATQDVSFSDDWASSLLLLRLPTEEQDIVMRHILEPILDQQDLLDTLDAFFAHGESAKESAAVLYVHVNTVRNHLARIQRLLGCDLDDPKTVDRLRMAILLRRNLLRRAV